MTFDVAVEQAKAWGATVTVTPRANWVALTGMFTPDQLRAIADEVERRFGPEKEPAKGA